MTLLLIGRSRMAGDFAIACQHGGRDYARVDAPSSLELALDQAKDLLVAQIDEHGVHAIVCAPMPFEEDMIAEASHIVAAERGLPIVHAEFDLHAETPNGPPWVWSAGVDHISDELGALGALGAHSLVVVDLSLSLAESLEELGALPNAVRWDVLVDTRRADPVGPKAITVDHALNILRNVGAQVVVVADRSDARTRCLLAAAAHLQLQVVALRASQLGRSSSSARPSAEAHSVLEVASWLRRVEQGHPRQPTP